MSKTTENLNRSAANGRRSTCISYGGTLYTSGVTTTDLAGDIAAQAENVLAQLDTLLAAYGTDKHQVLMAHIFLADMQDYAAFNAVWDTWVDDGFEPCRCVVQAGLPLPEYRVKIALTAATITDR